jgi:hypothetical protein
MSDRDITVEKITKINQVEEIKERARGYLEKLYTDDQIDIRVISKKNQIHENDLQSIIEQINTGTKKTTDLNFNQCIKLIRDYYYITYNCKISTVRITKDKDIITFHNLTNDQESKLFTFFKNKIPNFSWKERTLTDSQQQKSEDQPDTETSQPQPCDEQTTEHKPDCSDIKYKKELKEFAGKEWKLFKSSDND